LQSKCDIAVAAPAMLELLGALICRSEELWNKETDEIGKALVGMINAHVSLSDTDFQSLTNDIINNINL
jgi:hypothetical protein